MISRRDQEIVEARRFGTASLRELGDRYGITRERVRQIAAQHGVDGRKAARAYSSNKPRASDYTNDIMVAYYEGYSLRKIAEMVGYSIPTVSNIISENVDVRSKLIRAVRVHGTSLEEGIYKRDKTPGGKFWDRRRTFNALCNFAWGLGGNLPSSSVYMVMAKGRKDLPSLKTIQNNLGKYSAVRLLVYEEVQRYIRK